MTGSGARRRLAAILAADVAGYSRLMAENEDATVAQLDAARSVFKSAIESNQGRVIDMAGDSVLAIFDTAIGAVDAALQVQRAINALDVAPSQRAMRFRIGVHLGDVIEKQDGTVYGDGVNIAARLQALAEPGGVTVSSMVQEAVRDRSEVAFEDQGEHAVKNIPRPVHAFRADFRAAVPRVRRNATQSTSRVRWMIWLSVGLLVGISIGGIWVVTADSQRSMRDAISAFFTGVPAERARAAIVVLPFINQSDDAKSDYFSDGITQDIIHALGRFSGLIVISHNAVQAYKSRRATPAEISRELNVRYIVEGTVRQSQNRLRVAIELSDAEKGVQLWSDRYDGAGAEVFEIQDRIVRNIVGVLAVKLTQIERQRVFKKPTESLEAYDLVLRARSLIDASDRSANREARALLARAEKLSPDYAEIFTALGDAEFQRAVYGWVEDAEAAMARAEALGKRALASGDQQARTRAHTLLAAIYDHQHRSEEALSHATRAIELNGSDANALYRRGAILLYAGRIDEALASMEAAKRYDPYPNPGYGIHLAIAYYVAGRYRDSLALADALLARTPDHVSLNAIRAAALAQLGRDDAARSAAAQVRRFSPFFEVESFVTRFASGEYRTKVQDGLRKAGL